MTDWTCNIHILEFSTELWLRVNKDPTFADTPMHLYIICHLGSTVVTNYNFIASSVCSIYFVQRDS